MANEKAHDNGNPLALFEVAARDGTEIRAGEWAAFESHGDFVVGRVVGFEERSAKLKNGAVKLEGFDGVMFPVGLGGNLRNLVTDALLGKVVSIWYVADMPVQGKPQPMKVYRVLDHGAQFPAALMPAE